MHPSEFNALRVSVVAERLSAYFMGEAASSNSQIPNSMEYFNLLLSLSRGIDYSIANNEIPPRAEELPKVLNEIRLRKADASAQGIVMVLMISVKNACKAGWFHERDSQDLIAYTDEIGRCFCDPTNISAVSNESHSAMSTIFSRFYPQMKMGHVLAALEVQSGYGAFAVDFVIKKSTTHLPEEKIMLFVALLDSLETSACIITPQQVNFLLNGKGVERRTNVFMDPGPQIPSNVTPLLKYGTNLLQAVGRFNGRYVIYVAFMSMSPQPEPTVLKDYVQPVSSTLDSDCDLIEGQSRISLNCPISRTRIQVPVKGHSCKHPQCFDYSNYLGINSRRPSWRCPHCNNYVCFTDLRIDPTIVEVLKEVGGNVSDVLISSDGSWKAIIDSDNDDRDPVQPQVLENRASVVSPHPIFDLTEDDDAMDILLSTEKDDINPLQQLPTADTTNNGNPDEEFWSGVMEFVSGNPSSAVFKDTHTNAVSNQDGPVNADSGSMSPGSVQRLRSLNPVLSGSSAAAVRSVPRVDSEKQRSNQGGPVNADSGSVQNEGRSSVPANFPSPGSVQRLRSVDPVFNGSSSAAAVPSVPVTVDSGKQRSNQAGQVNADSGSVQNEGRNSVPTNFPSPGSVQRLRPVYPVLNSSSAAAVHSVPRVDSEKQRSNQDGLVNADSGSVQKDVRNVVYALPANYPSPGSVQRFRPMNPVLNGSSAAAVPSIPPSTEVRVDSEKQRSNQDGPVNADSGSVQKEGRNPVPANFPSPGSVQRLRSVNPVLSGSSAAAVRTLPPWAQRTPPVQNPNSPNRFTGFQNSHLQQAFNHTRNPLLARPAGSASETGGPPVPQTNPSQVTPGFQPSKPVLTEKREPEPGGGSDESWRPSGRMRGSLMGRALPDDISHLLIQPSRGPVRSGGPPPANLSAPPHLQKSGPTRNQNPQ